ncbi:MAG: ABC transporter permease [Bacilli bacterium]
MEEKDLNNIPKEKFRLVSLGSEIHDTKFETKPVSFLHGCWIRFRKNKSSVVAAVIICLIVLFALIVPEVSNMKTGFSDPYFKYVLPKAGEISKGGFWDGGETVNIYESEYNFSRFRDTERPFIVEVQGTKEVASGLDPNKKIIQYTVKRDTYAVGAASDISVTWDQYNAILKYEKDHKKNILLPMTESQKNTEDKEVYINKYFAYLEARGYVNSITEGNLRTIMTTKYTDSNIYYEIGFVIKNGKATNTLVPVNKIVNPGADKLPNTADDTFEYVPVPSDGSPTPIYTKYKDEASVPAGYRTDKDLNVYNAPANESATGDQTLRVDYYNYFTYKNGYEPLYIFGANSIGQDIFVRLADGARLSLALGIFVTLINVMIGVIYGAIAGYYGGKIDLFMERFTDILSAIPFIVVVTLFNLNLKDAVGPIVSLLFAFVLTGWIGVASTTRMQFYRFKDQEYVLASRTLGARDGRLIFKHILPNAAGTLITSCILMIPSVIFSESSLSYLGILDLSLSNVTSVGTLLNDGSKNIKDFPHMVLFPAIFISILMICFNLFGNGLRDAFNPTLRGSED